MSVVEFIFAALAAFRLTRLIVRDDITSPIRDRWWRRFPEDTKPGELIGCNYCVGIWVSATVLAAWVAVGYADARWRTILLLPAVAGAQALLSVLDDRAG